MKYGIAGLAAFAILGWIREPERHFESTAAAPERATFEYRQSSRPAMVTPAPAFTGEAVPAPQSAAPSPIFDGPATTIVRDVYVPARRPAERRRTAPEPQSPTRSSSSRHDLPAEAPVERAETRLPEPAVDPSTSTATSPVVRSRQQSRSTRQSAIIIGGAAAAGAAIGAISGGGKGAAIGAITAGAGGYVYDRMTRNRGDASSPNAGAYPQDRDDEDRFSSRFATPGFAQ
ncbi:MAG TPA: hypothetical protein VER03_24020 [Bryobacteraceae bacterium]|nr:hypothetical protein [Bryobacteraceae bacterium]